MLQGFGKPKPTKIDKLVERAVKHCHQRSPERLDSIFDNLPVELNERVLAGTLAALHNDADSLAWFCGYFAGAINRSDDIDFFYYIMKKFSIVFLSASVLNLLFVFAFSIIA